MYINTGEEKQTHELTNTHTLTEALEQSGILTEVNYLKDRSDLLPCEAHS